MMIYVIELHNGVFGEGLIVLQGLALLMLTLTGVMLFLWRRVRRKLANELHSESEDCAQCHPALPVITP